MEENILQESKLKPREALLDMLAESPAIVGLWFQVVVDLSNATLPTAAR